MDENNQHNEAADLQALRELDPAAGVHAPDALRDRVATIAEGETMVRARKRWLMPVAAAAALVVGVGGGYAFGAGAFTPSTSTVAGKPISVTTGTAENPGAPIGLGGSAPATGEDVSPDRAASPDVSASWYWANNRRFTVPQFEDAASVAKAYAIDGRAHYSEADIARIAAALGVVGTPTQPDAYGWQVIDPANPDRRINLSPTGNADLYYSTGALHPEAECYNRLDGTYDFATDVGNEYYDALMACVAEFAMPTEQDARVALSDFLSATGVDESSTVITVTPDEGWRTIMATASWVVDGNVTQVSSTVTVAASGLLSAYGPTGTIVSLGEYNIVSPAEAAARLNSPAFSPTFGTPAVAESAQSAISEQYVPPTEPPAVPKVGSPVPWGITEITIESVRLGLASVSGTDSVQYLVPAYEFTDTDGNTWSVIALTEDELDTTPVTYPSDVVF